MSDVLYSVKNLKVLFKTKNSFIKAVEGVDLTINKGESVAIVGESGCGKTVTAHAMMKLLNCPPAVYRADEMIFNGKDGIKDILSLDKNAMQKIRGKDISMIFQDPQSSLNPVITIGEQISEVFIYHSNMKEKEAKIKTIELLKQVGIGDAEVRYDQFPHQFSGGQKQRIMIAMATALSPQLLIADEPTTSLDVTVQAQILQLIKKEQQEKNLALLLITHDLAVVNQVCDRVYVMYCGKIVESGKVEDVLKNPMHPYTRALLKTIPSVNEKIDRFIQIPKNVPNPANKPEGCYFNNRCSECVGKICSKHMPPLIEKDGRYVRCWRCFNE